ncbi:MAG: phosphoribosylanthranilate isomerase [Steroidobacteraceae bacterium]
MWIKICGVTTAEAVAAALALEVDAIGCVFAPSVRALRPADAAALTAPARGRCALVAVTLHPAQSLVDEIVQVFSPDVLQTDLADFDALHLPRTLRRLPVLRGGAALPDTALPDSALPDSDAAAQALLFEGGVSGSGITADWLQAARLARARRLVLAGGLNALNVAGAIAAVRPFGVDVSSGVESAPGRKSAALIERFVLAARAAAREAA